MATYIISGNTYQHKDAIRESGARWDAARKVWTIEIRERGMKRNDSLIYQLRKLSGVHVERDGAAGSPPPSASSRPRRAERRQPPAGPQLRNDRAPCTEGEFIVAILRDAEIAECEQRQSLVATDVPATTDTSAKPLDPGMRRVGCVVIYTDRISQSAADDNGYCGRYGAIVRLATAQECADTITRRRKTASYAACAKYLEDTLRFDARGVTAVSDTGKLPPVIEREALRDGDGDTTVLVVGRKTGASGTHYVLTATTVVAHHSGYYDDYVSSTRTVARTELLADVLRAIARDDADAMLVCADRCRLAGGVS